MHEVNYKNPAFCDEKNTPRNTKCTKSDNGLKRSRNQNCHIQIFRRARIY